MARDKKRVGVHGSDYETGRDKKTCPVTLEQFKAKAIPILLRCESDQLKTTIAIGPREFHSGTLGWFHTQKVLVCVGGVWCKAGLQVTLTLDHSKPKDGALGVGTQEAGGVGESESEPGVK